MTKAQKLAKNRRRRSEISARLHDIGRMTAEQRTEEIETEERGLEDECATLDREHVQLLDAGDDPSIADPNDTTGEGGEIRALHGPRTGTDRIRHRSAKSDSRRSASGKHHG